MAARFFNNKKHAVCVLATSNSTIVVAGNNSVSNIASNPDEVVVSGHITQVHCGSPSGNGAFWQVQRGANTVAVFDSTAYLDFRAGMPLNADPTANLVLSLHNAADDEGYIYIEMKKEVE